MDQGHQNPWGGTEAGIGLLLPLPRGRGIPVFSKVEDNCIGGKKQLTTWILNSYLFFSQEPTGKNAPGGKDRKGGTREEGGAPHICSRKGSDCSTRPCLLHTRLGATLDFVVVVILQDCDGNCVVIFHL